MNTKSHFVMKSRYSLGLPENSDGSSTRRAKDGITIAGAAGAGAKVAEDDEGSLGSNVGSKGVDGGVGLHDCRVSSASCSRVTTRSASSSMRRFEV